MARFLRSRNPRVLGEDVESLLIKAAGVGATELANAKLIAPLTRNLIPAAGGAMAKLVDAGTTLLSAVAVGKVGAMLLGGRIGGMLQEGGAILAGGKGLSVVIPGFSISASVPNVPGLNPAPRPDAKTLPAGNGTTLSPDVRLAGQRTMGF